MKRILLFLLFVAYMLVTEAQPLTFTVTNLNGTNVITCSTPTVYFAASSNYSSVVSYSWASPGATLSGNNVSINIPGSYTVTASSGNFNTSQIVSVLVNTIVPTATVSPLTQSISCGTVPMVSANASTLTNVTHNFLTPYGGTFTAFTGSASYSPVGPGTYTYFVTGSLNGCSSAPIVFNITGGQAFPTFSVVSPQSFTIGCSTKSVAIINIINGSTSPVPGGPISYTILGPGSSGTIPSGNLSMLSTYTVNVAGTYTVIVRDNTTLCTAQIPISVIQNTWTPIIWANVPQQVLSCTTPSIQIKGNSSTQNVSFRWDWPSVISPVFADSILVKINPAAPSATIIANYTLTVTDNSSTCKNYTVVPMYQNTFPPKAIINSGGQSTLTCINPSIMLTNASSSGIPPSTGFPTSSPVIGLLWTSPLQTSLAVSTTFIANAGGVYTLVAQDLNNGCKSSATITIYDERLPEVKSPSQPFNLCESTQVTIFPVLPSPVPTYTYSWVSPPGAIVSGANTASLTTNTPGSYVLTVTDITGCSKQILVQVGFCVGLDEQNSIKNSIFVFPNPGTGIYFISSENRSSDQKIYVYNLLGELLMQQPVNSEKEKVDIQNEPAGIYLITIRSGQRIVYTGKLIKE